MHGLPSGLHAHTTLESHDTTSNAAIGSAKAEGRVMLTAEQNGNIEFIERDSNV
jgi:hypothetical protein